jgi:hypothetical protein
MHSRWEYSRVGSQQENMIDWPPVLATANISAGVEKCPLVMIENLVAVVVANQFHQHIWKASTIELTWYY